MTPFATHEKGNGLAILSMHTYVGKNTGATVAKLLASTASGGKFPGQFRAMAAAKAASGIAQWRMTEANSYFHGGAAGVSDVQAAALWSLDFMYGIASHDGAGVNFHGGTSTQFPLRYSPIVFSGLTPTGVQAVYYGELLWKLAGTGPLHAASVSGGSGVTAWAIGRSVFVNNEGSAALSVTLPAPASKALGYMLTAPSLTAKSITIAGAKVSADGAFGPAPRSLTSSGGKVVVSLPAHSAVLVVA
jgi:hypothetical protein